MSVINPVIPSSGSSSTPVTFVWADGVSAPRFPQDVGAVVVDATTVADKAFQSNDSSGGGYAPYWERLKKVTLSENVGAVGNYAFYGLKALTSVNLASVTSLGQSCFSACTSLASVEIPSSVTSMGTSCFSSCSSLASVEIPSSVTSLGTSCFSSCTSLASVEIPSSVTSMGTSCFSSCTSLASVEIPSSVTSLGQSCFSACTSLTSIDLPASITGIYGGSTSWATFAGCTGITDLTVRATTPPTINGSSTSSYGLFGEAKASPQTVTIHVPAEAVDTYKAHAQFGLYTVVAI